MREALLSGTVHRIPKDLNEVILGESGVVTLWNNLTPLARNEWICWVTFPKKEETRKEHVKRVVAELKEGKKRPCCWIGCIHRKDKAVSPSVKAILKLR